jgi:solute carrier family 25 (mitochondrial folate transporter), member 32
MTKKHLDPHESMNCSLTNHCSPLHVWSVQQWSRGTVPLYEEFKHRGERWGNDDENMATTTIPPALVHMGSAVLAGGIADVLINPMFVVRTRMQTEGLHHLNLNNNGKNFNATRTSLYQTVRNLYQEGGYSIFWRGMTANLLGLSHVAVQFPIYEQLKQYFRQRAIAAHHETGAPEGDTAPSSSSATTAVAPALTALQLLTASALSKLCACVIAYPHEVIRSRLMDSRARQVSLSAMCRDIYRSHGLAGFYAGLPISMIRVVPNTAIAFCVYELVLHELKQQQQNQQT